MSRNYCSNCRHSHDASSLIGHTPAASLITLVVGVAISNAIKCIALQSSIHYNCGILLNILISTCVVYVLVMVANLICGALNGGANAGAKLILSIFYLLLFTAFVLIVFLNGFGVIRF